ncbi:flavin monoamine oxidase family protein [Peribacillus alkalitolerans]|uniref:flavin monoamine oxidase family protein n=1 Tax=Peribacillus alkalitolerans TaxID=1550385 RepID=UPI0013D734E3|nr:flavin monoamine oxidase family protein [Peribacillus alkalitolerans]
MPKNKNVQLSSEQMIQIIKNGLPETKSSKHIIIVGAGMAGLVAASLLKDAGHKVTILEANNRIGGRVFTSRSPFSKGLYFNAGPMRISDLHFLTFEYIKKFSLPTNLFINRTNLDIIYANGIKTRLDQYEKNPDMLNYPVAPNEKGKSSEELLLSAVQPIIDFINQDPTKNWKIVESQYENYSLGNFLNMYFSDGAIDMIGVLLDLEAFMGMSFIEILREIITFTSTKEYYEITGGMDLLPQSFLPQLKEEILFHQKMTKISQTPNNVSIDSIHPNTFEATSTTADFAIITIPFSALRFVQIEPYDSFSYYKRKAIREINYMSSTKIGIEFKSRFWEKEGQRGGKTITELPIRFTFFPSTGIGTEGNAVIVASYTWADEALTWDFLPEKERIHFALTNLAEIYGDQVYQEFVTGKSFSWSHNPYSGGAFPILEPGQEKELFPHILTPEGRVHFAGEHTSLTHGWIQGAIESGIRVAFEVNNL